MDIKTYNKRFFIILRFLKFIKCTQPGCVGLITEENNLNIHVFIELDVRDSSNMANTMEYRLNDFPTSLELGKKYR